MALKIDISKGDVGVYKVTLAGSLDSDTAEMLDKRMEEVWADKKSHVVRLELHGVTYVSSMGLGSVARIKKTIAGKGGVMVTVGMQPQIARVFEIVKMLPKETVFVNHHEADDYLAAIQKQVIDELRDEGGKAR